MSTTAHVTASPRAPRAKHHAPQSPAPPPSTHGGRQSQRKPRSNRAPNGLHHLPGPAASPAKAASAQAADPDLSGTAPHPASATPAKIQAAYAGPTFHASPAPSALPIPKFLSRSVPAKTRTCPPTPPPEDSSDSAHSPSLSPNSPSRAPIQVPARNEDSPLDLLFKADRAERARNVHTSPAAGNLFGPMHPPRPPHYHHDSHNPANGLFPMELDGESRHAHMSAPSAAFPIAHRSVTDPTQVPQFRDAPRQPGGNDVMHDLLNRLSMSQKKPTAATPPAATGQTDPEVLRKTPSPFQDGRPAVRSTSGPSTPQPAQQDVPDFFYGNRNLSPMFKAAKNDSPKRNSGLRTEITAGPPAVAQAISFQDFPAIVPTQPVAHNTSARHQPGPAMAGPGIAGSPNFRHGSTPFHPPYQQSPTNRRTPGRQQQHPRPFHGPKGDMSSPGPRGGGKAGATTQPVNVPKPTTSMMSFVPASVSAKQHSSSAPPAATIPPSATKTCIPSDTSALEQDLKRLLNLKMTGNASSAR